MLARLFNAFRRSVVTVVESFCPLLRFQHELIQGTTRLPDAGSRPGTGYTASSLSVPLSLCHRIVASRVLAAFQNGLDRQRCDRCTWSSAAARLIASSMDELRTACLPLRFPRPAA